MLRIAQALLAALLTFVLVSPLMATLGSIGPVEQLVALGCAVVAGVVMVRRGSSQA